MHNPSSGTSTSHLPPFTTDRLDNLLSVGVKAFLAGNEGLDKQLGADEWFSRITEVGDLAEWWIGSGGRDVPFSCWAFVYEWVPQAKETLILSADIQFELGKGRIFHKEGKLAKEKLAQLEANGLEALDKSIAALRQQLAQLFEAQDQHIQKRKLAKWGRQTLPWRVYRNQFQLLRRQQTRIFHEWKELWKTADTMSEMAQLLVSASQNCKMELQELLATLKEAEQTAQQIIEKDQRAGLRRIASKLKEFEQRIEIGQNVDIVQSKLEVHFAKLPKSTELGVNYGDGTLFTQNISLRDRVSQWVRSEIFPYIFEIRELTENLMQDGRLTLLNLRNWVLLMAEKKEEDAVPLEMPSFFSIVEQKVAQGQKEIEGWAEIVDLRMKKHFQLSGLLSDQVSFLAVEGQTGIHHLKINRYKSLTWLQEKWRAVVKGYRDFFKMLEREESLTSSEKIVRFLRERQGDPENQAYSSIFRTRGFVSPSFAVGQEGHLTHVNQIVRDWEAGFRGSLLITGKRFAGKTHFAEFVALHLFNRNSYRLSPDSPITVSGRKFVTTCQLGPALEEVNRSLQGKRAMLLIDDIEGWWDPQITVQENLADLMKFMAQHGQKIFVVVTMGNSMRAHLEKILDLDQAFQGEVNLDDTTYQQVHEAIIIRHGATHSKLVDGNGEELSPQAFRKLTKSIYQASGGNIGEALNLWSAYIHHRDQESVVTKYQRGHELPDFLDFDSGILLGTILMQRQTNEFRLRKTFGPSFQRKYLPIVRRMIGTGILARDLGGGLELDPVVVNKVGELLHVGKFIHYRA